LALIKALGATGINYKTETVAAYVARYTDGAGFDVVFDSVGGPDMANSFEAAALSGQVASTVAMVELDLSAAHFKGLSLHVVFMLIPMIHNYKREEHARILGKLAEIVDAGGSQSVVDEQRFSLEEVGKAHDRLAGGQAMGRVVSVSEHSTFGGTSAYTLRWMIPSASSSRSCLVSMRWVTPGMARFNSPKRQVRSIR
jgi:NADPH2:quinone reductase